MESNQNRRQFIRNSAAITAGLAMSPFLLSGAETPKKPKLMTRRLGKTNFYATTMGLGGQASLQWTPDGVDPVQIILKAFKLGINYYDTSNVYGPSQVNYGKAFRQLNLIPGEKNYNKKLRSSIFLTSKSGLRWAKGTKKNPAIRDMSEGDLNGGTISDLKRTMTQIFGDGQGNYPQGAYLDMVLVHNIMTFEDLDTMYLGYDNPSPDMEGIGALAALLDYRDGTNRTGLNPKNEKLIRHIGISGHNSSPMLMEAIQRDTKNILDGFLVAINANDFQYRNMQYNVIPVAKAKDMGVIGMKVFSNGQMYRDQNAPGAVKVVRTVGSPELSSADLIQYTLTTPGVDIAIIGIGQIDDNPALCQLTSNLNAAQVRPEDYSLTKRKELEAITAKILGGRTNGFQLKGNEFSPPNKVAVKADTGKVSVSWHSAYAGSFPVDHYEIFRNDELIGKVAHKPQINKTPFEYIDVSGKGNSNKYVVAAVDTSGQKAIAEPVSI